MACTSGSRRKGFCAGMGPWDRSTLSAFAADVGGSRRAWGDPVLVSSWVLSEFVNVWVCLCMRSTVCVTGHVSVCVARTPILSIGFLLSQYRLRICAFRLFPVWRLCLVHDICLCSSYYSPVVSTYYSPVVSTYYSPVVSTYYSPVFSTYYSPVVSTYLPSV